MMRLGAERNVELLRWFDELSELAAEERTRQLAALAIEDPALAHDLHGMFGADADPDGPLEAGVESLVEVLIAKGGSPMIAGQQIGPFVLERPLGRGGMGEVWLAAREEGGFRQTVALKRLKRGMDSDEILRRFVQERRILAELSHPHIARFIDGGVGADGVPWYAMEYVDGVSITAHADARALDVRARVRLLAIVAEAVAYAQNRLVVHRDLKPSNILVDADGVPHLLDFGIAKLLQVGDEPEATATGVRALSPAYAAPEQILDQSISAATDVYALGVVLYELLTGELPHARSGLSLEALVDSVRDETIERPSARLRASTTLTADPARTQQTLRAVNGELDAIVLTALRREPERRYANAVALADDLRRWLDGRPVRAQPDTATYRMRKFVARNRIAVGSASAVLLALIAGFGTALWQANVAREQATRAETQARRAEAEVAKATAIKDFLLASFNTAQIGARTDAAAAPTTVVQLIERGGEVLLGDKKLDPEARLELLTALGELLRINGLNVRAEQLQVKALEVARDHYGATSEKYVYALVERATNLPVLGRRDEAIAMLDEAIAIMERVGQQDTESYPFALWQRGVNAYGIGRLDEALGFFERAEAACRAHRPSDSTLSVALQWQANVHQLLDQFDAAEAALRESLALAGDSDTPEQTEAMTRLFLGDLAARRGDFEAALAEYERSAHFMRQIEAGERNADRAVLLTNTARARHETGQPEAAMADVRAALEIARHNPSADPGLSLDSRARSIELMIYLGEGNAASAVPLARELSSRWPAGSNNAFFATNQMLLSEAELLGGDATAARAAAERAVAIHEATDADTLLARQARLLLAEAQERQDAAAARGSYQRVLQPAHADRADPPARARALQRARALAGLARLMLAADPPAALRLTREALAVLPDPRYQRERRVYTQLVEVEAQAR